MPSKYIIINALIACILLYFVEQVLSLNYAYKTIAKILLFTIIPIIYIKFFSKEVVKKELNYRKIDIQHLKIGILFGIASFAIVIIAYYILKNHIDINNIIAELQSKSKITPANFIFVGLYITFGNSFLEEYFFRGFIFLNLYKLGSKKLAYIFSSALFALYHIVIFKTWFNIWLIGLALVGLFTIGIIFNWLDTKSDNFINSWIVHIFADIAIVLIGLRMFMII